MMKVFAVLFISSIYIAESFAITCYNCQYQPPENCAAKKDPPNLAVTNCPQTPRDEFMNGSRATCYKVEKAIKLGRGDNITYVYQRGCTIAGGFKDFCDEAYFRDPELKCFLCHHDFCNGSFRVTGMKLLIVITALIYAFMSFENL